MSEKVDISRLKSKQKTIGKKQEIWGGKKFDISRMKSNFWTKMT